MNLYFCFLCLLFLIFLSVTKQKKIQKYCHKNNEDFLNFVTYPHDTIYYFVNKKRIKEISITC